MAFTVNFYTFSKRERSTAVPAGAGRAVSCTADEPLNLLAPEISLDWSGEATLPTSFNYARIQDFGRWYWITGWTYRDGLWWASLRVDALASWRSQIGSQNVYVFRSASGWSGNVADTLYPATSQRDLINVNLPKPFTIGGASASGAAAESGVIVLGIIGEGGTDYYGFTPAQLSSFLAYLFSNAYYNTVLTEFGATEYPEAKVAINPMQYIASAKFIPMGVSTPTLGGFEDWTLHAGNITGVAVGNVLLQQQQAYAFFQVTGTPIQYHTTVSYRDYVMSSDLLHPQADERGAWLNLAPYSQYELFYPPFGLLQLDPAALASCEEFRIQLTVDVWTATGILEVITDPGTTDEKIILRVAGTVGADIPLANIQTVGHSTMELAQHGKSAIAAAINPNPSAFLAAERSAVRSLVDGWIPHLSTMGSQGSTAQLGGSPKLMITHWLMAADDLDGRGRPTMRKWTLSTIPGYIMADADEISIPCTEAELTEIRAALREGFYYA